ncbi:hypothetical protein C8Q76DRAFT_27414 [Earliella scabrosa]|nr:hypothetical protein C8Q76DRAFT_27414 [Earliella scabrosa]
MFYIAILLTISLNAAQAVSETSLHDTLLFLADSLCAPILFLQTAYLDIIRRVMRPIVPRNHPTPEITLTSQGSPISIAQGSDPRLAWPHVNHTGVRLIVACAFLATTGFLCVKAHLCAGDDIADSPVAVSGSDEDDVFGFVKARPEPVDVWSFFGARRPAAEDNLWTASEDPSGGLDMFASPSATPPHQDIESALPRSSCAARDTLAVASTSASASWSLSVCALTGRCSVLLSSCASALRARILPASAPNGLTASASSCWTHLVDETTAACAHTSGHRRVFGMTLPPRSPLAFGMDDLEVDDGSYLRAAFGMADADGAGDGGFWPELDDFVKRTESGKIGAWYMDGDEMRGWIFPGRDDDAARPVSRLGFVAEDEEDEEDEGSDESGEWTVTAEEAVGVLKMAGLVDVDEAMVF